MCQLPGLRQVEHDGRLLSHTGGNSIGMLLGDLIPTEVRVLNGLGGRKVGDLAVHFLRNFSRENEWLEAKSWRFGSEDFFRNSIG